MSGKSTGQKAGIFLLILGVFLSGREVEANALTAGVGKLVQAARSYADNFGGSPLVQYGRFWEAQLFQCSFDSIVPTLWYIRPTPSLDFYKMKVCSRRDVAKCMYRG
jgi:hypothetical protein